MSSESHSLPSTDDLKTPYEFMKYQLGENENGMLRDVLGRLSNAESERLRDVKREPTDVQAERVKEEGELTHRQDNEEKTGERVDEKCSANVTAEMFLDSIVTLLGDVLQPTNSANKEIRARELLFAAQEMLASNTGDPISLPRTTFAGMVAQIGGLVKDFTTAGADGGNGGPLESRLDHDPNMLIVCNIPEREDGEECATTVGEFCRAPGIASTEHAWKFMAWNICGIKKRLSQKSFVDVVEKHDFVFCLETKLRAEASGELPLPPGFSAIHFPGWRRKRTKMHHHHGGVSLIYRDTFTGKIKTHVSRYNGEGRGRAIANVWLTFPKEHFDIDHTISVCCLYLPPRNSRFYKCETDEINALVEQLGQEINVSWKVSKVFVCGDLNARTGSLPDHGDEFRRNNRDKTVNTRGKAILRLCKVTGMMIANGRLHGDHGVGQFTCGQSRESVVDYLLGRMENFPLISDFQVGDIDKTSRHAPITFEITVPLQEKSTLPSASLDM